MDATQRFSNRVENYRRYRPSYPLKLLELIRDTGGLHAGSIVADIGSGTGILTRLLLEQGWTVHAVEPNAPMRQAAEEDLGTDPRFHSVNARGEATGLPPACADAITCAQAFHWLDRDAARMEFARVLKPEGWAFVIWNERKSITDFDREYSELLSTLGEVYDSTRDRSGRERHGPFFRAGTYREAIFDNPTPLTWKVLRGRFLSSSYVPAEDDPGHVGLVKQMRAIFDRNASDGEVVMHQDTQVFFGQM
jgi:SAM-dependent methyltransferase